MTFEELKLAAPLLQAVAALGYKEPTPIQIKAIPHALSGRDVLGCAQTGTGKTAAFALPILHALLGKPPSKKIRVLVLSPTRELAAQIYESFRDYGKNTNLRAAVIFGGVNQNPQTDALRQGVDILVATPGRLLDLMEQGHVHLENVEYLVLDEADRMLDMGFILDIRRIVAKVPKQRQTLFFSATMPNEIRRLADTILTNPVTVEATPPATTVDAIKQQVYQIATHQKPVLLAHLLSTLPVSRALIFVKTKHGADRVVKQLRRWGIAAEAIHGDKTQGARTRVLENFKKSRTMFLVATDIAARGLDIDDVSHVFNYDIPHEPETYVHRIGRTGRAGASGEAIAFCGAEEFGSLADIERLVKKKLIQLRADSPEFRERLNNPAAGRASLPEDEGSDHIEPHRSRGARGQGARRPHESRHSHGNRNHGQRGHGDHRHRDNGSRDRAPQQGGQSSPRPGEGGGDREAAYEQASAEHFKPERKEKKKREHQPPITHTQAVNPNAPGHPRRSQG
jgi:ATP-dependent RNA helicase RhlE